MTQNERFAYTKKLLETMMKYVEQDNISSDNLYSALGHIKELSNLKSNNSEYHVHSAIMYLNNEREDTK